MEIEVSKWGFVIEGVDHNVDVKEKLQVSKVFNLYRQVYLL